MGYLTTHVLDTAHGCPGNDISVSLYRIGQERELITQVKTNADGRCDKPVLEGDNFRKGVYELVFNVAAYYQKRGVQMPEPAFLGEVVLRFGIADEGEHYHVPLLISPYSYSTYRGS
ncbi:hydroxyisourate hydrolase [Neptunomonas antarctica]|uniref:5-hydroxyisourate hydrolase n=1 Tax=Neptunomonas antarctica TaxID=619304 RepID=A0A1N7L9F1_9GAMM|nr:hydroxyisourate hydrolase [Neptunomonas antarctica]SIS70468.1 5-hydroxyisourate hydrolase [Neptunomonas antarctica]